MSKRFENRVILVTGAARGLGFAYSKCLVQQGAIVAMQDGGVDQNGQNPDQTVINAAAQSIGSDRVFPVSGLLNSRRDCASLVGRVRDRFGRLDGLISNAGVVIWEPTTDVDQDTLRSSSAINHEASFWLCQEALPIMREQNYGRIVLTSSGWAFGPYPGSEKLTLYCMSKGAQFGFGMALAEGTGHPDIRVNVVAPIANTRIYASEVETGRLRPDSVAGTVAWLVSSDCDINGTVLKIADGNISVLEMAEKASVFLGERSADPVACGAEIRSLMNRAKP
ncbi:MAG: SDR family oxidoreductase [Pseudomonadota bacterium]